MNFRSGFVWDSEILREPQFVHEEIIVQMRYIMWIRIIKSVILLNIFKNFSHIIGVATLHFSALAKHNDKDTKYVDCRIYSIEYNFRINYRFNLEGTTTAASATLGIPARDRR